jgi:hypothetical protein
MNHLSYPDASEDSHEDVMNLALFLEKISAGEDQS